MMDSDFYDKSMLHIAAWYVINKALLWYTADETDDEVTCPDIHEDPQPLLIKNGEMKQTTQFIIACAGAESEIVYFFNKLIY